MNLELRELIKRLDVCEEILTEGKSFPNNFTMVKSTCDEVDAIAKECLKLVNNSEAEELANFVFRYMEQAVNYSDGVSVAEDAVYCIIGALTLYKEKLIELNSSKEEENLNEQKEKLLQLYS